MLALNGASGSPPVRVTVPLGGIMTSLLMVPGVLAALHVRTKTCQGQCVEVSLLDARVHAQCSVASARVS